MYEPLYVLRKYNGSVPHAIKRASGFYSFYTKSFHPRGLYALAELDAGKSMQWSQVGPNLFVALDDKTNFTYQVKKLTSFSDFSKK